MKSYIAETLYLTENTVRSLTKHIYTKVDVHSKQELMNLAGAYQLPPCVDKSLGEAIGLASTGGNFPFAFRGARRRVGVFD